MKADHQAEKGEGGDHGQPYEYSLGRLTPNSGPDKRKVFHASSPVADRGIISSSPSWVAHLLRRHNYFWLHNRSRTASRRRKFLRFIRRNWPACSRKPSRPRPVSFGDVYSVAGARLANFRHAVMNSKTHELLLSTCQCGKVTFAAMGAPILTGSCHCASCQEAGRRLEQLPSAPPVLDPDGGSAVIFYRKDRLQCMAGLKYLEEHRLKPESPTRRVVATCCNSAMFLDFTKGHWLSMYRNRFPTGAPPLEMRVMTKDRRVGVDLADDVPNHSGFSARFILKLLAARLAMGLRRTDISWGKSA